MNWFPIFLNLRNARCLVVGGGTVALRKTRDLLSYGACVNIVAPTLHEDLIQLVQNGQISHEGNAFVPDLLTGCSLVIAATDKPLVNHRVAETARKQRVPVNVVDDPLWCDFIMPAVVARDPVIVAISTGGAAPVLARHLKSWLETRLPRNLGTLARVAGEFRSRVKARIASPLARRRFWELTLARAVTESTITNGSAGIRRLIEAALDSPKVVEPQGAVFLVGAGPGDPELITLRAFRLMQHADVVLHDDLVSSEVLTLVRSEAERIPVGKRSGNHKMAQADINRLMIRLASQGKKVLRLKGGDPLIFGRCGEEMEALAEAGIQFEVVPGVTAASACAANSAIPLTHRDYAHSCVFINGHQSASDTDDRWPTYSRHGQTLVVYMGLGNLTSISRALQLRGWPQATPAALVANGTLPEQHVIAGTLADLPQLVERQRPATPALLIIGDVVHLHHKLAAARQGSGKPGNTVTNAEAADTYSTALESGRSIV